VAATASSAYRQQAIIGGEKGGVNNRKVTVARWHHNQAANGGSVVATHLSGMKAETGVVSQNKSRRNVPILWRPLIIALTVKTNVAAASRNIKLVASGMA